MPSSSINENKLASEPFYKPFGRLMKEWFGTPAYKLTIDAGFTCPNIDGSRATGGCSFCDNTSFSPTLRTGLSQVASQIERGKKFYRERFGSVHFLAYFQTFTNTYADVDKLKALYDEAIGVPDVVGMAIGTRPDCIDAEKLKLIQTYADGTAEPWAKRREAGEAATDKPFISIEYGMQTMHNETGNAINRAHDHAETIEAVRLTREYAPDAHLCLHLINGLPGETREMIHQTINECARLRPDSVKFHHCYVYENTRMAEQYAAGEFEVLTLEDHVNLAADCIERMPPETCMQRLVGEVSDSGVIAPLWGKKKMQIYQMITDELRRRGTYQSVKFKG